MCSYSQLDQLSEIREYKEDFRKIIGEIHDVVQKSPLDA